MLRLVVALACLLAAVSAQGKWIRTITNGPYYPQGRYFHSSVSAGNNAIVFGGVKGNVFYSDLFEFRIQQGACYLVDNGNGPSARAGACALSLPEVVDNEYDTNGIIISSTVVRNQTVIIMGGYDGTNYYDDVWAYNTGTRHWTQQASASKARAFHTCVEYGDPGNEILATYGGKASDTEYLGVDDFVYWNITTNEWDTFENNSPIGIAPTNRAFIQGIFQGDGLEFYGGYDGTDCLGDTWLFRFDDQSWFHIPSDNQPPTNAGYGGVHMLGGGYDYFGGFADCKYTSDQIYGISHSAPEWRNIPPGGISPPARGATALTRHGQDLLLYAGADGYFANGTLSVTQVFDDLWYYVV